MIQTAVEYLGKNRVLRGQPCEIRDMSILEQYHWEPLDPKDFVMLQCIPVFGSRWTPAPRDDFGKLGDKPVFQVEPTTLFKEK